MPNPYENLPETAFWRLAVANLAMMDIGSLWQPKFPIGPATKIATFGSCFAQHFGRQLRERKFAWVNEEPAPKHLSEANCKKFGYSLFSARTGNIYTTSLLKQWVNWSLGAQLPPDEVWEKEGRFYDPFRPTVEPNGFESITEMQRSRDVTIEAFRRAIQNCDVFVFTLGLTESWFNTQTKTEYPLCPGTVAGEFDGLVHKFTAQNIDFVLQNLRDSMAMMRKINDKIRFLFTISPVPLVATNSGKHVLVATSASKAILRTAAETVISEYEFADYFPSFEIINSPVFKGVFFEDNLRNVREEGVEFVMKNFFECVVPAENGVRLKKAVKFLQNAIEEDYPQAETFCDEELLDAFAPNAGSE